MDERKIVTLSREELHNMVWMKPVTKWAKEFGLSDVGFAKICRKFNVPLPGRGHWTMVKKGLRITPAKLKTIHDPNLSTIKIEIRTPKVKAQTNVLENDPLVLFEMMLENKIIVPERINSKHRLIKMAETSLKDAFIDKYGRVTNKDLSCLNINVCKTSLKRTLKIMNTLIMELEKREMKVFVKGTEKPKIILSIRGEELQFRIEEHSKQVEHKKTKSEMIDAVRYPHLYERTSYDYIPSGKLHLSIITYTRETIRKSWHDTASKKIEDLLNEIIIGFIKTADEIRKDRLAREKEEAERLEKKRLYEEKQRKEAEERERFNNLIKQVEAWNQSQAVITFIEHVKGIAIQKYGEIESGSDLEQWITWANKIAQKLDPTSNIIIEPK